MAHTTAEQKVEKTKNHIIGELEAAEKRFATTRLQAMNVMAEVMSHAEPTADLQSFLIAMHGIIGTDWHEEKTDIQVRYEKEEDKFSVQNATIPFGGYSRTGYSYKRPPADIYTYPFSALTQSGQSLRSGDITHRTALRYEVRQSEYRNEYIGSLLVPAYCLDAWAVSEDRNNPKQQNYIVGEVIREFDAPESRKIDIADTLFGSELAGWAKGHHVSHYADALSSIADMARRLNAAMAGAEQ